MHNKRNTLLSELKRTQKVSIALLAAFMLTVILFIANNQVMHNALRAKQDQVDHLTNTAQELSDKLEQATAAANSKADEIAELQEENDNLRNQVASFQSQADIKQQADTEQSAKHEIAYLESTWNPNAINGQYCGEWQTRCDITPLGDEQMQSQIADEYVSKRYKTWTAALQFHKEKGWY